MAWPKTTMKYPYSLIRKTEIQNTDIPILGDNVEQREFSFIADGSAKQYSPYGRHFVSFLQN